MSAQDTDPRGSLQYQHDPDAPMTLTEAQDAMDGRLPQTSMDPLSSATPLTSGRGKPYVAPILGSIDRPVFGPEHLRPPREITPVSVPLLNTHEQLQRDQQRREAAAQADRERVASMPTREEQLLRSIAALNADVADLRVRLARLEAQGRSRGRVRDPNDLPPRAA